METTIDNFVPILFKVLFAFVIINMLINLILLYIKRVKIYKLLALYWPSVLLVFIIQSLFQTGNLPVTLAYSISILSCSIFAMIGFEAIGRNFPVKKYAFYFIPFYPITIWLDAQGFSFTIVAMPFAIATASPMLHSLYYINIVDRKRTTKLQKVLGIAYALQSIHCINFALFRMDPGAQLWGWLTAYLLYDMAAILLPAIALEEAGLSENVRLQKQVDLRTAELNQSLKDKEKLLKVVLHDLSSPLMTLRFYLTYMKPENFSADLIEKARKSQIAMEKIIHEIKNLYGKNSLKDGKNLQPVTLEECFDEVQFIFAQKLQKKNVTLVFNNELPPETKVLADQTTLTHSVLSNLVSNGLKFSFPHSLIRITAREESGSIILEVKDQGPGIPEHIIQRVLLEQDLESTEGTSGEIGSGFGLSIVKSFVDSFGGQIEFKTRPVLSHPEGHGTDIRITLEKA